MTTKTNEFMVPVTKETYMSFEGRDNQIVVYIFNKNKDILSSTNINMSTNEIVSYSSFDYDENGNCVYNVTKCEDKIIGENFSTYDKDNNILINKSIFNNKVLYNETEYYNNGLTKKLYTKKFSINDEKDVSYESTSDWSYDENKNCIKMVIKSHPNITTKTFEYNDKNECIKSITTIKDIKSGEIIINREDTSSHEIINGTEYYKNNIGSDTYIKKIEIDPETNIKTITNITNDTESVVLIFDSNGNILEEKDFEEPEDSRKYTYNNDGKLIKAVGTSDHYYEYNAYYDIDGELICTIVSEDSCQYIRTFTNL